MMAPCPVQGVRMARRVEADGMAVTIGYFNADSDSPGLIEDQGRAAVDAAAHPPAAGCLARPAAEVELDRARALAAQPAGLRLGHSTRHPGACG